MSAIHFMNRYYLLDSKGTTPANTTVLSERGPSELCMLHNMVAEAFDKKRAVNRFADKEAALRRTWKILEDYAKATGQQVAPVKEKKAKPEPKSPAPKNPGERRKRIMRFTFAPDPEIRPLKDMSTLRGQCVTMLKAGATFTEVEALVEKFDAAENREPKNVTRRSYELVRIMHYYLGYGIKHDIESGIITLYTKK